MYVCSWVAGHLLLLLYFPFAVLFALAFPFPV